MAELRLIVLDPAGLHARPAAQIVRTAGRFQSRITIRVGPAGNVRRYCRYRPTKQGSDPAPCCAKLQRIII